MGSAAKRGGAFNGGYHIGVAGMQTFAAVCANVWNADKTVILLCAFAHAASLRVNGTLVLEARQKSPIRSFKTHLSAEI